MPKNIKETDIETYFKKQFAKAFPSSQVHKYEARRSEPDRICLLPNGVTVFVELKRPDEVLRPEQIRAAQRLSKLGFVVFWANTKALVDAVVEQMIERYGASPGGCGACGGPYILLRSLNKKICADCGAVIAWELKPGQKPLL